MKIKMYSAMIIVMAIFLTIVVYLPPILCSQTSNEGYVLYKACQSTCEVIGTALEKYRAENNGSYPDSLSRLIPNYFECIPTCPAVGKDTYSKSYKTDGKTFSFCCEGNNHASSGIPADYPKGSSIYGIIYAPRGFDGYNGCKSNCENIGAALNMYHDDNSGPYPDSLSRLSPKYLKFIPSCPAAGKDTYSKSYKTDGKGKSYSFCCEGKNHADIGAPEDYPKYSYEQCLILVSREPYEMYTQCRSNCKNIGTALEMYSTDNKGYYPGSLSRLVPRYLKKFSTCPVAGKDTYSKSYKPKGKTSYSFCCSGNNHTIIGAPADYPKYTAERGLITPPAGAKPEIPVVLEKGFTGYQGCQSGCKNIATALEMYSTDNNDSYPPSLSRLTPYYLENLPRCPAVGKDTYSKSYKRAGKTFSFCCLGKNHADIGVPADYPKYAPPKGIIPALNVKMPKESPAYCLTYCKEAIKFMGVALKMYAEDNNGRYPEKLSQLVPRYLQKIPECLSAGKDTYSNSYSVQTAPPSCLIYCKGAWHKEMGLPENFPQYSSTKGLRTEP